MAATQGVVQPKDLLRLVHIEPPHGAIPLVTIVLRRIALLRNRDKEAAKSDKKAFKCCRFAVQVRRFRVQVLPFLCSSVAGIVFRCAGIGVQVSP